MFRQLFIICCLLSKLSFAQIRDTQLATQLDSIYKTDQHYRQLLSLPEHAQDSLAKVFNIDKAALNDHLWRLQSRADSANLQLIRSIIKRVGYPGKTLVGTPANEAAFYVIQHSDVIDEYLPVIKTAAEQNELPFYLYAMMLDRSLMNNGKEQIYGTQGRGLLILNKKTGEHELKKIIWPIQDAAHVNERRKAAGFALTAEQNAARLGIEYKLYSLQDVKNMEQ